MFKTYRLYTYSYLKHIVGWLSHSVVELVKVVATSRMEMMMAQENPVLTQVEFLGLLVVQDNEDNTANTNTASL